MSNHFRSLTLALFCTVFAGCLEPLIKAGTDGASDAGGVVCSARLTVCSGTCVDATDDDQNCGACGATCMSSARCAASRCYARDCATADCSAEQVCISERCTPTTCADVRCASGQVCIDGLCRSGGGSCGLAVCPATSLCVAGVCVDPSCVGVVCPPGNSCVAGACVSACVEGATCTPANSVCTLGRTSCSSGLTCAQVGFVAAGATCGSGQSCDGDGGCITNLDGGAGNDAGADAGSVLETDAGVDGGGSDAGPGDAGPGDAGTGDGGTSDAGTNDAGAVVNGQCGAAARSYLDTATAYVGALCAAGTTTPSSPAFPSQGASVSWQCAGSSGGSTASCSANRSLAVVVTYSTTLNGPGQSTFLTSDQIFGRISGLTATNTQGCVEIVGVTDGDCSNPPTGWTNLPNADWSYDTASSLWRAVLAPNVFPANTYRLFYRNTVTGAVGSSLLTLTAPLANGQCGPAARAYLDTATAYTGALCTAGTTTPANPTFPSQGGSASWQCAGTGGGTTASCSATRSAAVVVTYSLTLNGTGQTTFLTSNQIFGRISGLTATNTQGCVEIVGVTDGACGTPPTGWTNLPNADWSYDTASSLWRAVLAPNVFPANTYRLFYRNTVTGAVGSSLLTLTAPLANGQCGPAARAYLDTATAYAGALCTAGTTTPSNPTFPSQGGSASWQCAGTGGGTTASCSATRSAAVVVTYSLTLNGPGQTTFRTSDQIFGRISGLTATNAQGCVEIVGATDGACGNPPTGWTNLPNADWSYETATSLWRSVLAPNAFPANTYRLFQRNTVTGAVGSTLLTLTAACDWSAAVFGSATPPSAVCSMSNVGQMIPFSGYTWTCVCN